MILSKAAIQEALQEGHIAFSPFHSDQIGPASVDLTLGDEFRVLEPQEAVIREQTDYRALTRHLRRTQYTLKPGELVLGLTRERITLAPTICGWLQGRSRYARLGLSVHITASFVQPGIDNRQVLEIYNAGPHDLILRTGERICQLILERMEGEATYTGAYKRQMSLR